MFRRGEIFATPSRISPWGTRSRWLGNRRGHRRGGDRDRTAGGSRQALRPAPAPGDGARITAGRLPVAVLPTAGVQAAFDSADQTQMLLVARFSALLDKTGRFRRSIPSGSWIWSARDGRRASSPWRWPGASGGRRPQPRSSATGPPGSSRPRGSPARPARRSRPCGPPDHGRFSPAVCLGGDARARAPLPAGRPVRAVALGDLDGTDAAELVVADEQILTTYRWSGGRQPGHGGRSNLPRGRPGPVGRRRAGDGPGPRQLIVVDQRGEGRTACARGARVGPSGFRVLYETSGRYLRVVRVGTEDWLLEQDAGETEPFEPDIRRLVWDGERFRTGCACAFRGA